jgi:hypothetical protein
LSGQVEVKKHSCRQDRDGQWIVSFEFHPDDIYNDLVLAKKNTVFNLTYEFAESDGARDTVPPVSPPEKPAFPQGPAPSDGQRMVTRAVMLCKDPGYWNWIRTPKGWWHDRQNYAQEWAIADLKERLGIGSRAELATNPEAQKRFLLLEAQYHAERRGG